MLGVLIDSQGHALTNGSGVYTTIDAPFTPPSYTGTVDREGLTALGGDSYDIDGLQQHVGGNKEDNDYWKVTEANLAFGPNGSTPLTGANRATIKANPDVRYFPKFDPSPTSNTSGASLFSGYYYLYAIPTHGGNTAKVNNLNGTFYCCVNLYSIGDLSNGVTSTCTSTANMFYSCYNLIEIGDISNGNLSNVTNITTTFSNCTRLRNIGNLSNGNTASVTNMSNLFNYCIQLEDIGDLSNGNTASVTSMTSMFGNCQKLKRLVGLSNGNVKKVTSFSSFCASCYNLSYIESLTNWDTEKLANTYSMFNGCYNLKSIGDLSNGKMGLVTNIYAMFAGCRCLEYVGDLSNGDVSSVNGTSGSNGFISAFSGCYNLKDVGDLSDGDITMSGTKNQINSMFASCYNLKYLKLKNGDVSKAINFTYTFESLRSLTELDVSGGNLSAATNTGTSAGTSIFAGCYTLKTLKLGPNFFNSSSITTYYFSHLGSGTPESLVESLYTNQTNRTSSSTLITIQIASGLFDKLKNNLPTGFTLTNTTTITIDSKQIKLVRT